MTTHLQPGIEPGTIVAEATPPGRGGISIVRLSGPCAIRVASMIASFPGDGEVGAIENVMPGRMVRADFLVDGRIVDSGMLVLFRAPHSFTGEDVVELHMHGNPAIVREIIQHSLTSGCVLAQPGEFLRRRFQSGKIDLTQVEALSALLVADEIEVLSVARKQLDGDLRRRLEEIRSRTLESISRLELELDFSEESYEFVDREELRTFLSQTLEFIRSLQRAHVSLEHIHSLPNILLLGLPNAGKSSLFNALVGFDRSIAHAEAGTTRDYVSESVRLADRNVRLIDTAGIRAAGNSVEAIGIDRALGLIGTVDLVLWMVDLAGDSVDEDVSAVTRLGLKDVPVVIVGSKADRVGELVIDRFLQSCVDLPAESCAVSVLKPYTLEVLVNRVSTALGSGSTAMSVSSIVTRRQVPLVAHIEQVLVASLREHFKVGRSAEFDALLCCTDLRELLPIFDALVGETTNEDVLDTVFGQFCVGK